jgi:uncharacterized lipoprotein YmbA
MGGGKVFAGVVAALLVLSGCGSSPPTRFYTLNETPASGGGVSAGVGQVVIGSVSIPGEIDRPEIVRKVGANQLSVAGSDRWAAPLEDIIRRVLIDDIARRAPGSAAEQQRFVSVDIHEFYGDAGCNVTLRAVWTLKQTGVQSASEEISVPSSGECPATLAATMSMALGQLSDRIIAGVARVAPAAAKK